MTTGLSSSHRSQSHGKKCTDSRSRSSVLAIACCPTSLSSSHRRVGARAPAPASLASPLAPEGLPHRAPDGPHAGGPRDEQRRCSRRNGGRFEESESGGTLSAPLRSPRRTGLPLVRAAAPGTHLPDLARFLRVPQQPPLRFAATVNIRFLDQISAELVPFSDSDLALPDPTMFPFASPRSPCRTGCHSSPRDSPATRRRHAPPPSLPTCPSIGVQGCPGLSFGDCFTTPSSESVDGSVAEHTGSSRVGRRPVLDAKRRTKARLRPVPDRVPPPSRSTVGGRPPRLGLLGPAPAPGRTPRT